MRRGHGCPPKTVGRPDVADGRCQNSSPPLRSCALTRPEPLPDFEHASLLMETFRTWTAGRVRPAYGTDWFVKPGFGDDAGGPLPA